MVKIAAGLATALALVSTTGLVAPIAGSSATVVSRNMVVVTTTADTLNGDVSSLSALKARPGRDGISLREALSAADKTGGSATVYIMFSAALNGKTIEPRTPLPSIHRDHFVLEGIAPNGAPARVALDGRRARKDKLGELLLVQASEVTVRWLRFTGVDPRRNLTTQVSALVVRQGLNTTTRPFSPGPSRIANVQIIDDVFDNSAVNLPHTPAVGGNSGVLANALMVGTDGVGGANTHISGITIARNLFRHFNNDACGVLEATSGDTANGVVILDNTFEENAIGIELGAGGKAPRIVGTQIIGNTITGSGGITIGMNSSTRNGTIDQTLIDSNTISGQLSGAIAIGGAAFDPAPAAKPAGDVTSNTRITNNVVHVNFGAIGLSAANGTSSPPNRISGVVIANDTLIADQAGSGSVFASVPNGPGASGNQITDVAIRNSILYVRSGTAINDLRPLNQLPDVVMNSLISGPGWAGTNGNITGDPLFVNASAGDYHLAASSPAINAGTTLGAPTDDIAGAWRDAQPDIGAFEFGAVARPALTVTAEQLGGSGTVTSSPSGITCGTSCSARFDLNATVTLTAKPDRGSRFLGWQSGCSGKARCTITLNSAQSVTARFDP